MRIKLDEKWYLTSDTNCYKLATQVKDKDTVKLVSQKYYTTVESALNGYAEIKIKESQAESFRELREDIEAIRRLVKNISEELKIKVI